MLVYELSYYAPPSSDAAFVAVVSPELVGDSAASHAAVIPGVDTPADWVIETIVTGRTKRHRTELYQADVNERTGEGVFRRVYRVRARNIIGWSDFSEFSSVFVLKWSK